MKPSQSRLTYIKGKSSSFILLKKSLDLPLFRDRRSQNRVSEFYGFWGNMGVYEYVYPFFQTRKKEKYAKLKWILTSFVGVLIWVMMT